jgi:hypothetical protein
MLADKLEATLREGKWIVSIALALLFTAVASSSSYFRSAATRWSRKVIAVAL